MGLHDESYALSLDPATHHFGLALWRQTERVKPLRRMVEWAVLSAPDSPYPASRITWMRESLDRWLEERGVAPQVVVCEWLQGHGVPAAPQLDTLVLELRAWCGVHGYAWVAVDPRHWRTSVGGRDKAGTAVVLLHTLSWPPEQGAPTLDDVGLNAFDAIGIGLYYQTLRRFGGLEPRILPGRSRRYAAARRSG